VAVNIVRLFSDVEGETIELFGYIVGMDRAEFSARFPGVKGRKFDGRRMQVAADGGGRVRPVTRAVEFKKRASLHKCDYRCMFARGPNCECSCAGKNHGRGDAGAQVGFFEDTYNPGQSGFFEDKDARVEELAADFALNFMGGALELGGEQMGLDGIGGGGDTPQRAPDRKQITLF
jgi:hypothetical protein